MSVTGGTWSLDATKRQTTHTAFDPHEGAQTQMRTLPARNDDEVMERVRARLKAQLGQDIYASWFQRMKIEAVGRGSVQLSVPTAFLKTWINGHYKDFLQQIFAEEVPGTMRVDIQVRSAVRTAPPASVTAIRSRPGRASACCAPTSSPTTATPASPPPAPRPRPA